MAGRFRPLTTPTTGRSNLPTGSGPFGSGSARLGLSQKGGLPRRCWIDICWRFKAIDAREGAAHGLLLCMRTYRVRSARKLLCCRNLAVSSRNAAVIRGLPGALMTFAPRLLYPVSVGTFRHSARSAGHCGRVGSKMGSSRPVVPGSSRPALPGPCFRPFNHCGDANFN